MDNHPNSLPANIVKTVVRVVANDQRGFNLRCAVADLLEQADVRELAEAAALLEEKAATAPRAFGAEGIRSFARQARKILRQGSKSAA